MDNLFFKQFHSLVEQGIVTIHTKC